MRGPVICQCPVPSSKVSVTAEGKAHNINLCSFHISLASGPTLCLTHNPVVLGARSTGSSGVYFVGVTSDKTLQSPSQVLLKPRKEMNNVSCDMTEMQLDVA